VNALPSPAWFVGFGNMAGAMVEGWRRAGLQMGCAIAIRPSGRPAQGVRTVPSIPAQGSPAFVMLGFKPQILDQVTPDLEPHVGRETLLVSILAGVELASLRARFPRAGALLRAMPNLPVSEGKGVVALVGEEPVDAAMLALFEPLGLVHAARNEAEFAAIGALAGAGPAYVARFVAALASAGEVRGLAPELSAALALQTVLGTAAMADAKKESMDALARRVASPKGTTEAGLAVMDADAALDDLVERTLEAAARRGAELAATARG
jgi:pyrroline-5-carboxylate reductase